jgi:L-asparaginase
VPVALIAISPGEDGRLLDGVVELGYRGLVVEALGGGHVPQRLAETLSAIVERMPVVLASRTNAGELLHHTYRFPGSEEDLLGRGLIAAGALNAAKSRALLGLVLSGGGDEEDVARAFATFGAPPSEPIADRCFAITTR